MNSDDVVIVSAVRSPIGSFGGQFKDLDAIQMGVPVMQEVVKRAGIDPGIIDDVGWGCCYQQSTNQTNIGRVTLVKAGFPDHIPGFAVQRVCTSAMWATAVGTAAIKQGDADVFLSGGVECMSSVPYTIPALRWGARMRNVECRDAMWDGLTQLGIGPAMGVTAENLAKKYNISREEQDAITLQDQQRAGAAMKEGRFKEEILPIEVKKKGKMIAIDTDEHPKPDTTMEALAALKPVFVKDGTVTAGNASGINDGASALIIMRKSKADELGLKPMAKIVGFSVAGCDPDIMGWGPVPATQKLLAKTGLKISDIGLWEIHKAFAAQYLACEKGLGLSDKRDIINVNGSGIALGHPVGCTGTRLMITLLHEMRRRDVKRGLATLCGGGGVAMAAIIELP